MPGLGFLVSTVENAAMMQRRRVDELWRSRDFRALVFLGVLGILTLILAFAIRGILGPFILAGILAMLLNPAVNAAERRRVPRLAALLALYGIIAAVLAAAVYFLAPIVTQEFSSLVAQGPAIASYFQDLADKDHVVSVLGIPIDLRQAYNDAVRNLPALLAGHLSSVVENVFMLVNWVFQTVLVLLVAFFLVKDARLIRRFFRDHVPSRWGGRSGRYARASAAGSGFGHAPQSVQTRSRTRFVLRFPALPSAKGGGKVRAVKLALVSGIHSTLEAIDAVLEAVPDVD